MQVGKVDASREGRLVLEDGLIDCCIKQGIIGWYDGLIQVGMVDTSRDVRCKQGR